MITNTLEKIETKEEIVNNLFIQIENIILDNKTKMIYQINNTLVNDDVVRVHALEEDEIYVSTNTACSSGELSTSVMAIFNDKIRATTTIRISLSYVTTNEEITKFLNIFSVEYQKLRKFMREKN